MAPAVGYLGWWLPKYEKVQERRFEITLIKATDSRPGRTLLQYIGAARHSRAWGGIPRRRGWDTTAGGFLVGFHLTLRRFHWVPLEYIRSPMIS